MSMQILMVDKNGNEWVAGSAVEINDLQAQGYRVKGTGAPAPATALSSGPEQPTNPPSEVADPAPVTNTGEVAPAGDVATGETPA